jgi:hypothetical protein
MAEPIVYDLKYPITTTFKPNGGESREETLTQITLRRATGADLRTLDRVTGDLAKTFSLIEALGGVTKAQTDKLDAEDILELGALVASFLPGSPRTGETS